MRVYFLGLSKPRVAFIFEGICFVFAFFFGFLRSVAAYEKKREGAARLSLTE